MGRMYPQLMGPPRQWVKGDSRQLSLAAQHLKLGLAGFAVLPIHPLPGALGRVTPQRQIDDPR
jgi:hypothetical protein